MHARHRRRDHKCVGEDSVRISSRFADCGGQYVITEMCIENRNRGCETIARIRARRADRTDTSASSAQAPGRSLRDVRSYVPSNNTA